MRLEPRGPTRRTDRGLILFQTIAPRISESLTEKSVSDFNHNVISFGFAKI